MKDACLAPGAGYSGHPAGGWGTAAAFSLGVRKPISAGEGGMVTTNDGKLAAAIRSARSLGADPDSGEIGEPSSNHRLTELQAAAALPQLLRLDADLERRMGTAHRLTAALESSPWFQPLGIDPQLTRHAWAQYWIRYGEGEAGVPCQRVVAAVQAEGIPLFEGWSRPAYCLAMYTPARAAGWLRARDGSLAPAHYERTCCPNAERAAFGEALLLDFPLLDAEPAAIDDAVEALAKVSGKLEDLRERPTRSHADLDR